MPKIHVHGEMIEATRRLYRAARAAEQLVGGIVQGRIGVVRALDGADAVVLAGFMLVVTFACTYT